MLKLLTIVGARPQIIKAAALSRAINNHFSQVIKEIIVHTGQHYDQNMSGVFFDELNIPSPDFNLQVGSMSHAAQTAAIMEGIERLLISEKPNYLVVYGDTNSTLAGALAAAKIHIPIVHIEAGLRSYNKLMPEEINRVLCDHCSTLLFSPTSQGYQNLLKEGFKEHNTGPYTADNPKIYHSGDVMYDNSLFFAEKARTSSQILPQLGLDGKNYILATIHRNNNTDEKARINSIFSSLNKISIQNNINIVLPIHPRTAKALLQNLDEELYTHISNNPLLQIIDPVSFIDMISLEYNCQLIITDSGGVQKEAYFFKKPCIVLRAETEWIELVDKGYAILADAHEEKIVHAFNHFKNFEAGQYDYLYGDGNAATFICKEMLKWTN